MTRKRDRYTSGFFDEGLPGIHSATYDIGLALYLLEAIAKREELLRLRTESDRDGQSFTVAQLIEIAHDALNTSVTPVAWVYERLQQNEEAARLMEQTLDDAQWSAYRYALSNTLANRAIISRGFVTGARAIIAKRDKEAGGDAPYLDDWCADPTLSHDLCTNSACECSCHAAKPQVTP